VSGLAEQHWETLLDKIRQQSCTPFIGAGACAGVLPLGNGLTAQLRRSLRHSVPANADLARVAQYLAVERRDNSVPKAIVAKIIEAATPPAFVDDEPHAVLATLGAPIYLTTNYDDFMFRALVAKRPRAIREACRWTRSLLQEPSAFDKGLEPSPDNPVVFHLHGGVGLHGNRSMVLTEDDYLDYLVNISKDLANNPRTRRQRGMLPLKIRAAITNSTLLFVGYSLTDINFRVLLRGLVGALEPAHQVLNLAVQLAPEDQRAAASEIEDLKAYIKNYFDWTLRIQVHWSDARAFTRELKRRVEANAAA